MASATDTGCGGRPSGARFPGVGVATGAAAASALNTGLFDVATVAAPRHLGWLNDGAEEEDVERDALSAKAMQLARDDAHVTNSTNAARILER
jgi:hypothetical protein